jgi:hypothetical protein
MAWLNEMDTDARKSVLLLPLLPFFVLTLVFPTARSFVRMAFFLSLSLSPINFFIYLLKVVWSLCSKCLLVPEGGRVFWMLFSCFFW